MTAKLRPLASLLLFCLVGLRLWAGGSGLNVVVVVNQNSSNSVALGNYYCEKRQVPPQNVLRLTNWTGGATQWYRTNFTTLLLNPLLAMVASRGLTNQAQIVVLSSDIPYRIRDNDAFVSQNSTTAALFYGFKSYSYPWGICSLPDPSSNSYAFSELPFADATPNTAATNSFLAVMLTHSNLAAAKLIVDRGIASDATFPTQTVYLAKTSDIFRNVRYSEFDNAIFSSRLLDRNSLLYTNTDATFFTNSLGLQTGLASLALPVNAFVPGALGDSLTSFAGNIFEDSGQTSLLAFLTAGAVGSYGTVIEPCSYVEKFPDPQAYFYQARGFCMAEAYYQSLLNPYMGLLAGEPLSAPYALPASGSWNGLPANPLLAGTTNLSLQFLAPDTNHPVQQVDLFVDGTLVQTLTNIPPRQNNTLSVTLRGRAMSYTVPAGATIQSAVNGLTAVLNNAGNTNITKVRAFAHGDRIQLQSFDLSQPGGQIPISVGSTVGGASALTTFIAASRTNFLDTTAFGIRSYQVVSNAPFSGSYLLLSITKTNGLVVTVGATNSAGNTSISTLVQTLVNNVNASAALQGPEGVTAEDFIGIDANLPPAALFNLRARSLGWQAAQIQANLSGSAAFGIQPSGTWRLDENLSDLQPRNHLYVTAGATNLPLTFAFNTTTQADGWHELCAVAYEGSHVRTQKRITQTVHIQNTPLSATFTTPYESSNLWVGATLQFAVVANSRHISRIELFSTGGALGSMLNQSNALFSVAGTYLGVGLHPFYALVTASDGNQYRTETKWIRLVTGESSFQVSLTTPPPFLSWAATAGRSYDVLGATNVTNAFQTIVTLTPSNSAAQWIDTNPAAPRRFYRVRASD